MVSQGKWVVIGSSTAAGAGATTQGWASRLASNYSANGVTITNLALGGTTSYSGLPTGTATPSNRPAPDTTRNITQALTNSPKLVLVSYPTNDIAFGYSADELVNNLMTISSAGQAGGTAVIVLSTQPRNLSADQLATLAQVDTRLSAAFSPCFVAVRELLAGSDGKIAPAYDAGDGVNINDAGHAVIYSSIKTLIDSGACVRVTQ